MRPMLNAQVAHLHLTVEDLQAHLRELQEVLLQQRVQIQTLVAELRVANRRREGRRASLDLVLSGDP